METTATSLDDRVREPGKFEGERYAVMLAWEQYLNGFADDDGEVVTAEVTLNGVTETVRFVEDDQGFVTEVR